MEALITREVRNTHKLLYNHIQTIRSDPMLTNALCVLNFESNLAFESQHLLHHLHETGVKNWVSLAEGAHNELGWLTTHARKEAMALQVREALRVGKLSYYYRFFSVSMSSQEAKKRLGDELRNFSVITEPGRTHFAKVCGRRRTSLASLALPPSTKHALTHPLQCPQPRKTYTGKVGGQQDDCCIAFQLVIAAIRTFFESPKYSNFSKQSFWNG